MRTRTLALALVLAAALALAGCNGGPATPTNATTATNATTVTDAPTTTTPPSSDVSLPSGVTDAGLTNETALFGADWRRLNESGFVAESWFNRSTSGPRGSDVALYRRGRVEAGGQVLSLESEQRTASGTVRTVVWRNATLGLNRLTETTPNTSTTTRYRRQDEVRRLQQNPVLAGSPTTLVSLGNYTITSIEGSGADTRITLTADSANATRASQLPTNVTQYSGEVVVDQQGRIRSVDVTLGTSGRQSGTFSVDYDLERTGSVTVSRPNWFETALARAPQVELSAELVNDSYVELRNEGPDRLEASWQVQLRTRFRPISTDLSAPVAGGETVYLWLPANSTQLQVTRSPPTNETRQLVGISGVSVVEVSSVTGQTYPIAGAQLGGRRRP